MRDWKKIAEAEGFAIPPADLERSIPVLDALEAAFRPLVGAIPPEIEPATVFRAAPEEEE
ncbi:MAG: hypothetical protein IT158_25765 [Bryobacterales bacterium]|nr:hypothetical protein [Bryobacterales bacterium]